MKTNLKPRSSNEQTFPPTAAPAPLRRPLQGGQVLLKGQLSTKDGESSVVVSMDAAAVSRMIAVQEALGRTVSTTGKDSIFGIL